ncbi:MAG: DUF4118 domain-containing protein [Flavobacteriales bacterium]
MQRMGSAKRRYGIALLAVVMAGVVRGLLDPVMGDGLPYYIFYFAVIAGALLGGVGPGLSALVLGYAAATYFFAPPRLSLELGVMKDVVGGFRFITLGAVIAVAGGLGRWRLVKWRSEVAQRRQGERLSLLELERTHNTLAAVGDGLIITDTAGRVTFMNGTAMQLTGWESGTAHGRGIEEVLPLVNLHTSVSVPNPALRALREGVDIGLQEHTCLVDRYGHERLISESAAPIRDHQQVITGAVLMFRPVVVNPEPMIIDSIVLYPADGVQPPLPTHTQVALENDLRTWLGNEWKPGQNNVRFVSLKGFDLTVHAEETAPSAEGPVHMRFRAAYQG